MRKPMDNQGDIGAHSDWETWGKGQKRRLGHAEPGNRDALLCQIPREISIGYQVAKKAWIWQCMCLVGKHPSIFTILIYSYHLFVRWSTPFFFQGEHDSINPATLTMTPWTWPILSPVKILKGLSSLRRVSLHWSPLMNGWLIINVGKL